MPFLTILCFLSLVSFAQAQSTTTTPKVPIYGEGGLGAGQTLFFNQIHTNLSEALGGSFTPGK